MGPPLVSLDDRIAADLAEPPAASVLLALIVETTAAIDDADAAGRIARAQSVDPKCADGIAARGRAEDTEFRAARWRNGLAALQALHADVQAREEAAAWRADADRVQRLRDELVTRFVRDYPVAVAGLVDLFAAVVAIDKEIDRINRMAPALENSHRLRKVEGRGGRTRQRRADHRRHQHRRILPVAAPEPVCSDDGVAAESRANQSGDVGRVREEWHAGGD
jgi:hypothetical protein